MDEILNTVLKPGPVVLALAIYILTTGIKKFVEMLVPNLKKVAGELSWAPMFISQAGMWWDVASIHLLPVALGFFTGCFLKSPFLFPGVTDWGGRALFGGAVGWFSGTIYKGIYKAATSKLGLPASSIAPAPDAAAPR